MLAIVVAAASVVVPLGLALKMAWFDATGVQAQEAPPAELDQLAPVFHAPPAPIRSQFPAATPQLGAATTRTAPRTQLLPPPMVHVIAVPGFGKSLPAPQRLVRET